MLLNNRAEPFKHATNIVKCFFDCLNALILINNMVFLSKLQMRIIFWSTNTSVLNSSMGGPGLTIVYKLLWQNIHFPWLTSTSGHRPLLVLFLMRKLWSTITRWHSRITTSRLCWITYTIWCFVLEEFIFFALLLFHYILLFDQECFKIISNFM